MTCPLTWLPWQRAADTRRQCMTPSRWKQATVSCLRLPDSVDPRWQLKPDAANKCSKDVSYVNQGWPWQPSLAESSVDSGCWTQDLVWDRAVSHHGTMTAINTTVLVVLLPPSHCPAVPVAVTRPVTVQGHMLISWHNSSSTAGSSYMCVCWHWSVGQSWCCPRTKRTNVLMWGDSRY